MMGIVHFPYRWFGKPKHTWENITCIWYAISGGIWNVIRWTPVIWHDRDWDWEYLAKIMEYKLHRMAKYIGNGHLMNGERHAREMQICAELLRRMREHDYFPPDGDKYDARRAAHMEKTEQELLGRIIGKHFRSWWD